MMICNYCDGMPDREPYACCEDCRQSRLRFTVELPDDGVTPWYRRVLADTPPHLLTHYMQKHPDCKVKANTIEAKAFLRQFQSSGSADAEYNEERK